MSLINFKKKQKRRVENVLSDIQVNVKNLKMTLKDSSRNLAKFKVPIKGAPILSLRSSFKEFSSALKMTESISEMQIINRKSLDEKHLVGALTERQQTSLRPTIKQGPLFQKRAMSSFRPTSASRPVDANIFQDDINENVSSNLIPRMIHKTKLLCNEGQVIGPLRAKDSLVRLTPVFKAKFKENLRERPQTTLRAKPVEDFDENVSVTVKSLARAKTQFSDRIKRTIPCLSFHAPPITEATDKKCRSMAQRLILYFHANGEDLANLIDLLSGMSKSLNTNVVAMEYPGYSLYKGEPSEEQILEDAEGVFYFITKKLGIHSYNIVVVGRSLGSGPAVHLASKFNFGGLLLVSPFTSIKAVARNKVGGLISHCIKERFDNLSKMDQIQSKLKIVHGKLDDLVPLEQSRQLAGNHESLRTVR